MEKKPPHLFINDSFRPLDYAVLYPENSGGSRDADGYSPSSIQFKFARGSRGVSRATLVGKAKQENGICRYVFLTCAHCFTGELAEDNAEEKVQLKLQPLYMANPLLPRVLIDYTLSLHPKTSIHIPNAREMKFDIALFSIDAPCVDDTQMVPFQLSDANDPKGPCYINQSDWLFQPGSLTKSVEKTPYTTGKERMTVMRKESIEGEMTAHHEGNSNYRVDIKKGKLVFEPGDSGSSVFQVKDNKYEVVGCFYAGGFNKKTGDVYGIFSGGKEALNWIREETKSLLEGKLSQNQFVSKEGVIELPRRYFAAPRETSIQSTP